MKTVNLPINVPDGEHCWTGLNGELCPRFDNEGGHDKCELFSLAWKRDDNGYPKKAKECMDLKLTA